MIAYWLLAAAAIWLAGPRRPSRLWIALGALVGAPGLVAASALPLLGRASRHAAARLRAAQQRDDVRRAIPGLLTDLSMAAEAGQPLHAALRFARLYADGALQEALDAFQARLDQGASIAGSLEELRLRLKTQETDRLVGLLARDAQLGLPLRESVARYRRNWLQDLRKEHLRAFAYLPYVFTALAGLILLEGIALVALPWFLALWHTI